MNKPRILLVTHQFTPHVSPRTTRWSILCTELVERGYDVTVLTGTKQDEHISKKYRVIYIGSKKIGSLIENTRKASSYSERNSVIKKFFFYLLKKVYRFFIEHLLGPTMLCFGIFQ